MGSPHIIVKPNQPNVSFSWLLVPGLSSHFRLLIISFTNLFLIDIGTAIDGCKILCKLWGNFCSESTRSGRFGSLQFQRCQVVHTCISPQQFFTKMSTKEFLHLKKESWKVLFFFVKSGVLYSQKKTSGHMLYMYHNCLCVLCTSGDFVR